MESKLEIKLASTRKLVSAIESGDFDSLLQLLDQKPDLNVYLDGMTVFHHALRIGKFLTHAED